MNLLRVESAVSIYVHSYSYYNGNQGCLDNDSN